jgi:hypothetical protein
MRDRPLETPQLDEKEKWAPLPRGGCLQVRAVAERPAFVQAK